MPFGDGTGPQWTQQREKGSERQWKCRTPQTCIGGQKSSVFGPGRGRSNNGSPATCWRGNRNTIGRAVSE